MCCLLSDRHLWCGDRAEELHMCALSTWQVQWWHRARGMCWLSCRKHNSWRTVNIHEPVLPTWESVCVCMCCGCVCVCAYICMCVPTPVIPHPVCLLSSSFSVCLWLYFVTISVGCWNMYLKIIAFPANIFKVYQGNEVCNYMVQCVKPCLFVCTWTSLSTLPRESIKVFFKTRMCLKNCDEFSVQLHANLATSEIPRPTCVRSVTTDSTNQNSGRTSAYRVWTTTPQWTRPLPTLASACVCFSCTMT